MPTPALGEGVGDAGALLLPVLMLLAAGCGVPRDEGSQLVMPRSVSLREGESGHIASLVGEGLLDNGAMAFAAVTDVALTPSAIQRIRTFAERAERSGYRLGPWNAVGSFPPGATEVGFALFESRLDGRPTLTLLAATREQCEVMFVTASSRLNLAHVVFHLQHGLAHCLRCACVGCHKPGEPGYKTWTNADPADLWPASARLEHTVDDNCRRRRVVPRLDRGDVTADDVERGR